MVEHNKDEFEDKTEEFSEKAEGSKQGKDNSGHPEAGKIRVRLPKGQEVFGIIEDRLGGNKMSIHCLDGKSRVCRVPGRLRRKLWLRRNDVVIVEPWELDNNKGDVVFKYRPNQVQLLKQKGYLDKSELEF